MFNVLSVPKLLKRLIWTGVIAHWLSASSADHLEQRADGAHADALYTSGALTGKLEIGGSPQIHLWVNATVADGEFFAYLEDVQEDESVLGFKT